MLVHIPSVKLVAIPEFAQISNWPTFIPFYSFPRLFKGYLKINPDRGVHVWGNQFHICIKINRPLAEGKKHLTAISKQTICCQINLPLHERCVFAHFYSDSKQAKSDLNTAFKKQYKLLYRDKEY